MILDQTGAKLNYTGTGTALTLGPTGLSETGTTPIHEGWYIVRGGMFTGGQSATHAILINKGVVNTITEGVKYFNYGTNGNAAEYVSGNNWVVRSVSDDFQNDSVSVGGSWFEAAPDANTQIHIVNNFYRGGGAAGNFGAKLTGVGSSISHSQGMSGGNPNLAIVQHGHSVVIDDVYMECSTGCIKYGTAADLITGLTIQNSYFNLHQNGYVLFPGHANTGLQGMKFVANKVNGVPTNGKLIQQTAIGGQSNNQAYGNLTYAYNDFSQVFDAAGIIHDQVGTVASWSGSQGEQFTLPNASWIAFYDASGVPTSLVSLEGDNNLYLRGHATEKRIIIKADPVGSIDALFSPGNLTFNAHMYVNGYLDVQTGTQLRGYSDSGTTKKFTLDASDGTADFVTGYKVNGTAGITKTVTRQKNGGGTCTETYTGGILTASDC
jgi:hypothetical protein